MTSADRYEAFLGLVKEIHDLDRAEELLSWDQQTYMPPKGAEARASQLSTLTGLRHDFLTGDRMADLLAELGDGDGLSGDARVNLREIRRLHERERKVPKELVKEMSRIQALSQQAWVDARKNADFSAFAPWLEKILDLRIRMGDAVGFEESRYDAFLDEFEPGATASAIGGVFDALKAELVPFVAEVIEAGRRLGREPLGLRIPVPAQEKFGIEISRALGFDFDGGRLDVSAHPFTSGNLHDVRLTTRYDEREPAMSIFGTLHEAGHGMYEQGVDPAHEGTPRGASVSLGIHESQSRLWENMVGRSLPFWEYAYPMLQKHAAAALEGIDVAAWHREVNRVAASLIRVEADEVTYNLHILLRFEIEKAMAEKTVFVNDLPELWNGKVKEYLGITPPDAAAGLLQDIHWSFGLLGYFPTYALGNLYAAQFYRTAKGAIPGLEDGYREGRFAPLLDWLRAEIHRRGKTYTAGELVKVVTGEELNAGYLMEYLREKYGELYQL
ncbi:MAG: carboxypeptidase M32 [Candidatus Eisenbacteria bacterium]